MISFVWSPDRELRAGTGGSENYTIGQVYELNRRNIPARIVIIGPIPREIRKVFPDLPISSLGKMDDVATLNDIIVFVHNSHGIQPSHRSYLIVHVPPQWRNVQIPNDCTLIATSHFAANLWAEYLRIGESSVRVVYPFAAPAFATQVRSRKVDNLTRILYASRLSPEKGIYTFLEMLHMDGIADDPSLIFSVTTAGSEKERGKIIRSLVEAHPRINVLPAATTPSSMASLMGNQDVVVVPSNGSYWHETFGMVSVEAQHAGCHVVASRDGGLLETDCGGVIFVEPNNAKALAGGILVASKAAPVTPKERQVICNKFTVTQSVDSLLAVLGVRP